MNERDLAEHRRIYSGFVMGVGLFAAHVAVALVLVAYLLSDGMG